jgi:DNA-binding MarR family transcriptional regulator
LEGLSQEEARFRRARSWIYLNDAREKAFGVDFFADPAWHMLLDLYVAYRQRGRVSVSSLSIASRGPPTTGLRWIAVLERYGLIERTDDPFDKRRIFVSLTADGLKRVERTLDTAIASDWKLDLEPAGVSGSL